ncbi:proline-rich protein 12-like [Eumetopias jubatus]|uniref:proline-rich protein 12-like n=1 Tax=Eumetopias jubatus TaxID=34886 RepID=UPI0010165562|nr:proline-rich protein 12-like [Eumetopias jubatus]
MPRAGLHCEAGAPHSASSPTSSHHLLPPPGPSSSPQTPAPRDSAVSALPSLPSMQRPSWEACSRYCPGAGPSTPGGPLSVPSFLPGPSPAGRGCCRCRRASFYKPVGEIASVFQSLGKTEALHFFKEIEEQALWGHSPRDVGRKRSGGTQAPSSSHERLTGPQAFAGPLCGAACQRRGPAPVPSHRAKEAWLHSTNVP